MLYFVFFFFFKQKTAYEWRISDWSSDVCSSDLGIGVQDLALQVAAVDHVVVGDAQVADAGGGKIERGRRPEPAGTDHQHARQLQPPLPAHADLRQQQVAREIGRAHV